jgi:hypothetical protein
MDFSMIEGPESLLAFAQQYAASPEAIQLFEEKHHQLCALLHGQEFETVIKSGKVFAPPGEETVDGRDFAESIEVIFRLDHDCKPGYWFVLDMTEKQIIQVLLRDPSLPEDAGPLQ